MTYCVLQDLIDQFGTDTLVQLTDRNNTGQIDQTVIDQNLMEADELINQYVGVQVTLPLTTVPSGFTKMACDITRYFLGTVSDRETALYNQHLTYLRNVGTRKILLAVSKNDTIGIASNKRTFRFNDDFTDSFLLS